MREITIVNLSFYKNGMSQKPYILFFSNQCGYSRQILAKVQNNQAILEKMALVNVDNASYNLPPFVDRVPMIFVINTKELVVDDNVDEFVKGLEPKQGQGHAQGPGQLTTLTDMAKGISGTFSFIDAGADDITPLSYDFINPIGQGQGNANANSGRNGGPGGENVDKRGNKIDTQVYDNYKTQRDLDDASFFPARRQAA